jgi:trk system potassium uptake protein TrkA
MIKKFAVIGLGQFGSAIAKRLSKLGAEVLAIDMDQSKIDNIGDEVSVAVALDATDTRALESQDIENFDAVVVAIGGDFEQLLLTLVALLNLNVKHIIARAAGKNQRVIIERLGITEIFSPEDEVGIIVAEKLINPTVLSYLQLPDNYRIAEIFAPIRIIGRTIEDLDIRDKYKLSLITIKKQIEMEKHGHTILEQHIFGVPESKTTIQKGDCLVVFGIAKDIERFIEINS